MEQNTFAVCMDEYFPFQSFFFCRDLERERLRWKQSSDGIIYDLMYEFFFLKLANFAFQGKGLTAVIVIECLPRNGYETELLAAKAALEEAKENRFITELEDKSSQVAKMPSCKLKFTFSEHVILMSLDCG